MATGIVKGEKLGEDALLANSASTEPFPLPSSNDNVRIEYPNKISPTDILNVENHTYTICSKDNFKEVESIPTNSFMLADNFYALRKLIDDYQNKVTLIYLDPPYGTGKDFVSRELKHAYTDIFSTVSWIEFMRRRLILMRELLADNGSIYIHIGHQMLFHLKVIMDEVFGEKNFKNIIVRKKCSSKNYTKNQYPNLNDYILFYTKTNNYVWNQPTTTPSKEWIDKEYTKVDEKGRYKLVPIHAPGIRNGETGKPWKGLMPPKGKHWQLTPKKLDELDKNGEIHWSKNGNPRRKVYLTKEKQIPITDYWDNYRDAHHQSIKITGYPTEKNLDMLKMIVRASSNEGDIVLDPFSGSGTTLHAANDLKRSWIGIDQSFTAAEATIKRLKYGLQKMGDYVNIQKNTNLFESSNVSTNQFNIVVDSKVIELHKEEVDILCSI